MVAVLRLFTLAGRLRQSAAGPCRPCAIASSGRAPAQGTRPRIARALALACLLAACLALPHPTVAQAGHPLPALDEDKTRAMVNADPQKARAALEAYVAPGAPTRPEDQLTAYLLIAESYDLQHRDADLLRAIGNYLEFAQQRNDRANIARAMGMLGYANMRAGNLNDAVSNFLNSARLAKEINALKEWSFAMFYLTQNMALYGNYEYALKLSIEHERAVRSAHHAFTATDHFVRAQILYSLKRFDAALNSMKLAEANIPGQDNKGLQLPFAAVHAKIAAALGRDREAEQNARKCLKLNTELHAPEEEIVDCEWVLAKLAIKAGAPAAARPHLAAVERTLKGLQAKLEAPDTQANDADRASAAASALEVYGFLADLADAEGDFRKKSDYLEQMIKCERILAASRDASQSAVAAAQIGAAGKDLNIAQLKASNAEQRFEANRRLTIAAGTSLTLLGGLGVWFLWYRARQARLRLGQRYAERLRIAQDLHDTLLQSMAGAQLSLAAAAVQARRQDQPLAERLDGIGAQLSEAMSSARGAVWQMRSEAIERGDLARAVRDWVAPITAASAVNITVDTPADDRPLKPDQAEDLFRIVQEAVGNAVRHAAAKTIEVRIEHIADSTRLSIRDDGIGIDASRPVKPGLEHWGLQGMRERAARLGAALIIDGQLGHGTRIELTVPA